MMNDNNVFLLRLNKKHDGGYINFNTIKRILGSDVTPILVNNINILSYGKFIRIALKNSLSGYIINQAFLCLLVYLSSLGRARIVYIMDSIDNNYPDSALSKLKSSIIKLINKFLLSRKKIHAVVETAYLKKELDRFRIANSISVLNTPFPLQENICSIGPCMPVRLLYVGRMSQEKGVDNICNFIRFARINKAKYKFDLIGDGELITIFDEVVSDNVVLHGWKSGEEVKAEYLKGGIFLHLPNKDAYPTSIREAMSHGLPVISFRQQGIPELIDSGVNGILLNSYDPELIVEAISSIVSDYSKYSEEALKMASENNTDNYELNLRFILVTLGFLGE